MTDKENKNLHELLSLMEKNPELPVLPLVDCDDWHSTSPLGSWGNAYIAEYLTLRDNMVIRDDTDWWGIIDVLESWYPNEFIEKATDDELHEMYAKLNWKKAIFVDIEDAFAV